MTTTALSTRDQLADMATSEVAVIGSFQVIRWVGNTYRVRLNDGRDLCTAQWAVAGFGFGSAQGVASAIDWENAQPTVSERW